MSITIGILIPRSDIFPVLPQHIVKGIKLAFENAGIEAQFVICDIGKGVVPDVVMAKANELIMQDVDITIAYAGKKVLDSLKSLFKSSQKPLMLMGMGPNISREEEYGEVPYIASNSFDSWQASYFLGEYAAKNIGKSAIASIGLFEGGYQFLPVFNEAVERNGGLVVGTHITKQLAEADFTVELRNIIETHPADYLVEFYSGIDSPKFYELCIKNGISKELPIITTSLGVEPFAGYDRRFVHGLSWQPFIKNAVNEQMITSFTNKHNEVPSAYVAVAYETALWVIEGVKACGDKFNTATYCDAISIANFLSPRGNFTVNKELNSNVSFPVIIVDSETISNHTFSTEFEKELVQSFSTRIQAGWFNPYPCA